MPRSTSAPTTNKPAILGLPRHGPLSLSGSRLHSGSCCCCSPVDDIRPSWNLSPAPGRVLSRPPGGVCGLHCSQIFLRVTISGMDPDSLTTEAQRGEHSSGDVCALGQHPSWSRPWPIITVQTDFLTSYSSECLDLKSPTFLLEE